MRADVLLQAEALGRVVAGPIGNDHEVLTALWACANELSRGGEGLRALTLLDAAEQLLPRVPADMVVSHVEARVLALLSTQRYQDALQLGTATLRESEMTFGDSALLYRLRIYRAQSLWRLNRLQEAKSELEGLRTQLLRLPDGELLALCTFNLSAVAVRAGDWSGVRAAAYEAWVSARRCGSDWIAGMAMGNICIAERGLCHWHEAEDCGREAVSLLERAGAGAAAVHAKRSLAIALHKRGRSEAAGLIAVECLEAAIALSRQADQAFALLLKGQTELHLGLTEKSHATLVSIPVDVGRVAESRPELLRLEYLGDVELEQGNWQAALERFDEVLPHALALIPRGDVVAELRRRRAECYQQLGRAQEAYDEAREGLALCLELGDRYEEAATYRTLALSAAMLGRADEAKKQFEHGFAMYDDIETPYEWGKLWMSYGDWLCGKHAGAYESEFEAREAYRAACDHFELMGAQLKLAQARTRLADIERRMAQDGHVAQAHADKPRPRRRPSRDRDTQRRMQWAFDTFGVVTQHRPMLDLLEQVATVAVSDIPVLVLGESGTGKELIARGVHALSGRTGALVEVNCSAVPATMMESEFFGSVHGSYTGSTRDRAGLFEEAHSGSIFMDEIGEMPVDLQAKLLRFLETGEVRRIGANAGRRVDARLIAATNREADKMRAGDGFRQDLYYRLAHAVFTLPPLRSRGEDASLLIDHFLAAFNEESKKHVVLSTAARSRLLEHTWPGNVRELRALLQRVVVQSQPGHTVTPREIPLSAAPGAARNFVEEMEHQEKARILEALEKTHYIKSDAARMLRMSRTTLLGKMKRYQIAG